MKQGRLFLLIAFCTCLSSCIGGLWTGASIVYDRHNVYKKVNDYHLFIAVTNALYPDKLLKAPGCSLDIAVFNGEVLIAGHLSSAEYLEEERRRLKSVRGYKRLFNEVSIDTASANSMQDGWITAKIRSQIFSDDTIDPNLFKIMTVDRVVYLMGEAPADQAEKVVSAARKAQGVVRVVKLMKYLVYKTKG